jgi:hypothetical protein
LRDYALDPEHSLGKHKARVFAAALGFTANDSETLRDLLLAAAYNSADAIATEQDEFGQRFIIDFDVERNDRKATVRSAWIIRTDEDFPRLTSCYVL